MKQFSNETFQEFSKPAVAAKQRTALAAVRKAFGKEYPNIINGKRVVTKQRAIILRIQQRSLACFRSQARTMQRRQ
jgi:hypothetical protein